MQNWSGGTSNFKAAPVGSVTENINLLLIELLQHVQTVPAISSTMGSP